MRERTATKRRAHIYDFTPRETQFYLLRYDTVHNRRRTLEEVAEAMGISRQMAFLYQRRINEKTKHG